MRQLGIAVAVALVATAAWAQPRRFEITPHVGYRFLGEVDLAGAAGFDLEIDDAETLGVFVDIPLTGILQLELLANRQETQLKVDAGPFLGGFDVADVDVTYYHVGLLAQFGPGQVNPYVVGSLGVASFDVGGPVFDDEDRFSLSFGGGVKVFVTRRLGLRFEGRGYWVALDTDEDFDDCCDPYDDTDTLTQAEVSVGVIFAF